jgi:hypothetical protein
MKSDAITDFHTPSARGRRIEARNPAQGLMAKNGGIAHEAIADQRPMPLLHIGPAYAATLYLEKGAARRQLVRNRNVPYLESTICNQYGRFA